MVSFQVRLPVEINQQIEEYSNRRDRTKAHVIRQALEIFFCLDEIAEANLGKRARTLKVEKPDGTTVHLML